MAARFRCSCDWKREGAEKWSGACERGGGGRSGFTCARARDVEGVAAPGRHAAAFSCPGATTRGDARD
jgi:hypothetical protein